MHEASGIGEWTRARRVTTRCVFDERVECMPVRNGAGIPRLWDLQAAVMDHEEMTFRAWNEAANDLPLLFADFFFSVTPRRAKTETGNLVARHCRPGQAADLLGRQKAFRSIYCGINIAATISCQQACGHAERASKRAKEWVAVPFSPNALLIKQGFCFSPERRPLRFASPVVRVRPDCS